MKKFNKRNIMLKAWEIFRKESKKNAITFGEALHRAWQAAKAEAENAKRVAEAKTAAGVEEQVKTWFGWKQAGFEVAHGSKCLFQVELIWAAKGDGKVYKASFFGRSQVNEVQATA